MEALVPQGLNVADAFHSKIIVADGKALDFSPSFDKYIYICIYAYIFA